MAEIILSPGVLANENDQSQIRSLPVVAGAAIIGPTVKGKPNIPRLVTTFSEFQAEFGTTFVSGSTEEFSFLTSISANNYFQQGGTSLLVTRVATGSFAPATSSLIPTGSAIGPSPDTSPFVLETLSEGEILNSTGTPGTNGILPLGTSDNLRWEITQPSTDLGVFTLLIRRGDDTTNSKTILETFTNLSLDPKQSNYIERVVGNQVQNLVGSGQADVYVRTTGSYANASRFVRVKQVNFPTPNYFDNNGSAKAQFTSSIPAASSGTFGGATGKVFDGANTLYQNIGTRTQGLTEGNYTDAINLLSNKDEYQFNVISTPGLNNADHGTPVGNLIEMVENRGDAIAIVD